MVVKAAIVEIGFTVAGDISDFSSTAQDNLASNMRVALGCFEPECRLRLIISAGSVEVGAQLTILNTGGSGSNAANLAAVSSAATSLTASAATLSSALGISATAVSAPIVQPAVSIPLVLAPPPPSQPSPPSPPPVLPPSTPPLPPPASPSADSSKLGEIVVLVAAISGILVMLRTILFLARQRTALSDRHQTAPSKATPLPPAQMLPAASPRLGNRPQVITDSEGQPMSQLKMSNATVSPPASHSTSTSRSNDKDIEERNDRSTAPKQKPPSSRRALPSPSESVDVAKLPAERLRMMQAKNDAVDETEPASQLPMAAPAMAACKAAKPTELTISPPELITSPPELTTSLHSVAEGQRADSHRIQRPGAAKPKLGARSQTAKVLPAFERLQTLSGTDEPRPLVTQADLHQAISVAFFDAVPAPADTATLAAATLSSTVSDDTTAAATLQRAQRAHAERLHLSSGGAAGPGNAFTPLASIRAHQVQQVAAANLQGYTGSPLSAEPKGAPEEGDLRV